MCEEELIRDVPAQAVRAGGTRGPHGIKLAPSAAEPAAHPQRNAPIPKHDTDTAAVHPPLTPDNST
jgi:hypothetical protein